MLEADEIDIQTVDDLIQALSTFDGSTPIRVQDRMIPLIGLRITRVSEDVFCPNNGSDYNIVLIQVQAKLD